MRHLIATLTTVLILSSIGCGPPDMIIPNTDGVLVVNVGPARLTFDMVTRTISEFNTNFLPIGMEVVNFDNRSQAVWTNYYLGGNSADTSPPLAVLVPGISLNVEVVTYSGKVTAAIASALRWTGVSQLQGLAADQITDADVRVFTIGHR